MEKQKLTEIKINYNIYKDNFRTFSSQGLFESKYCP